MRPCPVPVPLSLAFSENSMKTVLFVHGVGGSEDGYEMGYLREFLAPYDVRVVVKDYTFDPDKARAQILPWVEEYRPDLIIGESLGACYAMLLGGAPHLFISPAINAPKALYIHRNLSRIPFMQRFYEKLLDPGQPPVRQKIDCSPESLSHFRNLRRDALEAFSRLSPDEKPFAFFGTWDILVYLGFVSPFTWRRLFGKGSFAIHRCGHVMNREQVRTLLLPKVLEILGIGGN